MSKFKSLVMMAVPAAILVGGAIAQTSDPKEPEEISPASLFGAMNVGPMYEQLTDVALKVSDRYLDHISKPETTTRLATYQKNYYDALLKQGFTEEQAFTLVREAGNPLALAPRVAK